MIKGNITMNFSEEGGNADVNLQLSGGLIDKCFIIDTLCSALKMCKEEKRLVFQIIADADDNSDSNDTDTCEEVSDNES